MEAVPQLVFLFLLIGVFYFMLIRPQKRRVDQHRRLVESLDIGDDIVTIGGLYGTITHIGDEDIELEAAPGMRLRFLKSAVARVVTEEPTDDIEEVEATPEEEEA